MYTSMHINAFNEQFHICPIFSKPVAKNQLTGHFAYRLNNEVLVVAHQRCISSEKMPIPKQDV